MLPVVFVCATLIAFTLHLFSGRELRTKARIVQLLLLYLLVINVGIGSLLAWYGHTFMADEIARKIGWQPGSPFQFEVALADLSWGVCGVLCIWLREGFWTATGIGSSVFLLGCAFGHIRQIIQEGNMAIYNAGPVLWIGDLAVPIAILALLFLRFKLEER
jgi:uncharacterized membrane protein